MPGVVLAVSPTGSTVVVNDQLRQVIYVYTASSGAVSSIGGLANHAQYSPDGGTVYITGYDPAKSGYALFVYSVSTGWSEYPLNNQASTTYTCPLEATGTAAVPGYNPSFDPFCGPTQTVTVPQVAAFFSGSPTTTHSFCPHVSATPPYFPSAGDVGAATAQLTATADGDHILGASGTTFSDIWLYQDAGKTTPGVPINACPDYNGAAPLTLNTTPRYRNPHRFPHGDRSGALFARFQPRLRHLQRRGRHRCAALLRAFGHRPAPSEPWEPSSSRPARRRLWPVSSVPMGRSSSPAPAATTSSTWWIQPRSPIPGPSIPSWWTAPATRCRRSSSRCRAARRHKVPASALTNGRRSAGRCRFSAIRASRPSHLGAVH